MKWAAHTHKNVTSRPVKSFILVNYLVAQSTKYSGSFRTYQRKNVFCFSQAEKNEFVSASKNISVFVFQSRRKYFFVYQAK